MTVECLDLLGIGSPKWDMKSTLNSFPKNFGIGYFGDGWPHAFGNPNKKIESIITRFGCPLVRCHVWWDGRNLVSQHAPAPLDFLTQHVPTCEKLALKFPNTRVYVSPSCEYRTNSISYIEEMVGIVQRLAPHCTPILTPEGNAPTLPGIAKEFHGNHISAGPGDFASWDGQSCIDGDIVSWKKHNAHAEAQFLWVDLFNMKEAHNTLTPDNRTASPNSKDYQSVIRLSTTIGEAPVPQFSGIIRPFEKPYLYKVWAEDMPGNNPRDKKPLIIIKSNTKSVDLVDYKGKKLGSFIIYDKPGTYPGGLTRYYSGLPGGMNVYGWQIADKCVTQSGSPWGWFKAGSVYWGPVNFAFRRGFFQ